MKKLIFTAWVAALALSASAQSQSDTYHENEILTLCQNPSNMGLGSLLLADPFLWVTENVKSINDKKYTWCCNHSSHAGYHSACTNTSIKYSTYEACRRKAKSHNKSNKGHYSGCY